MTVATQSQSTKTATARVAPTVAPYMFYGRKLFLILGWCSLNPTHEIFIPPFWKQLKAKTTNTGKKSVITHLLDPSNVGDDEVNIFLRKQLVTDITTKNFGFGYTTAYNTAHHGVTPFADTRLDPAAMEQLDIYQQSQDRATMITVTDKKNATIGPPTLL